MRAGTRAPDSAPRGPQTPPRRARPCAGTAPHRKAPRRDRPLVPTIPLPPHKLQGRGAGLPAHLVPEHLLPVLRALRMQVVAQLAPVLAQVAPVLLDIPHVLPDVLPVLSDVLDVLLDVLSPCAAEAQRHQRPAYRDHLESLHRRPLPGRNVCCLVGRTPGCIRSFTAGNV